MAHIHLIIHIYQSDMIENFSLTGVNLLFHSLAPFYRFTRVCFVCYGCRMVSMSITVRTSCSHDNWPVKDTWHVTLMGFDCGSWHSWTKQLEPIQIWSDSEYRYTMQWPSLTLHSTCRCEGHLRQRYIKKKKVWPQEGPWVNKTHLTRCHLPDWSVTIKKNKTL